MPRNGSGAYSLPASYLATTGTTITAIQHNVPLTDIEADLNAARPIGAGGTGASTAAQAAINLGVMPKTGGSFTGAISGTSASFSGTLSVDGTISTKTGVLEIGASRTSDGNAYVDLHATDGSDYEARIIRATGTNGKLTITQTGTGDIEINGGGALTRDGDGIVLDTRKVSPGTGLTGGGDFSADRTISADLASQAEAEAGSSNTVLMTPLRTKQAIDELADTSPTGSWVSVARTPNTTYLNSFGKDIALKITGGDSGGIDIDISPDGSAGSWSNVASGNVTFGAVGAIPRGWRYRFSTTALGYSTSEYR